MDGNFNKPLPNPLPLAGEGTNEKNIFIDEHAGKGGSYVIENGKRVLLERTDHVATNDVGAASTGSGQAHESPEPATEDAAKTTKTKPKGVTNA